MQTAIINSNSKSDMKLLLDLAKKIGLEVRLLKEEELEEKSLANAIKIGKTGDVVNTDSFIKKLRK
jgi:hypothetical protein